MAYVLSMSAFKIGNPVEGFIKMKSDYFTADSGHLCLHGFHVEANPILRALSAVHPIFAQVHEPLISEEMWVGAAAAAIKDMGAEKFLRLLLENLKGNYVAA